jgi:hypothetical protein
MPVNDKTVLLQLFDGISVRSANNLNRGQIFTVEDLKAVDISDLENIDGMGSVSLYEINDLAKSHNIHIKGSEGFFILKNKNKIRKNNPMKERFLNRNADILKMRSLGFSMKTIGEMHGITGQRVASIILNSRYTEEP